MYWPWSKAAAVYLSNTQCAVRRGSHLQGTNVLTLSDALSWCAQALNAQGRACTFYVGADLLQATLIEADAGARNVAEASALAQHRLGLGAQWSMQCAWVDPRIGALAVALPYELLEALRALAQRTGIQQPSVQPAFLTALRAAPSITGPWTTIIAEPGALVTLEGQGHRQHLGLQTVAALHEALPREQARARYAGGEQCTLHTYRLDPQMLNATGPHFVLEDA